MYGYGIHRLIVFLSMGGKMSDEIQAFIGAVLHVEEQNHVISLCSRLLAEKNAEKMIECAGYTRELFCERFAVASDTFKRWDEEDLTPLQYYFLVYFLCLQSVFDNRIHFCRKCDSFFLAHMPKGNLCPNCCAEMSN